MTDTSPVSKADGYICFKVHGVLATRVQSLRCKTACLNVQGKAQSVRPTGQKRLHG